MSTSDPRGGAAGSGVRWRAVLVDVAIVVGWVGVVSAAWRWSPWPWWAYYVVVFGGVLGYSLVLAPRIEPAGERR